LVCYTPPQWCSISFSAQESVMDSSKVSEYRKSIKFELVKARLAFDEFFGYAGGFITEKLDDSNVLAKIKIFDAYARWVGHL